MTSHGRKEIFNNMLKEIDTACGLVNEYDSTPHSYGGVILYQAESYMVDFIGENPGITITNLAKKEKKTKSACSQRLRKLMEKGYVIQKRNALNHREYMLYLTDSGKEIFTAHVRVNEFCTERALHMLVGFSDSDMEIYLQIQRRINEAFKKDVEMSYTMDIV